MIPPLSHPQELARLQALHALNQLDTPLDARFERLVTLAQSLLESQAAAISLVDADRQWWRAVRGIEIATTSREASFCGHTILQNDSLIVPDAAADPRFAHNPLVTGAPGIRFYAGHPLRSPEGLPIGSLCIFGNTPRTLTSEQAETLRDLATITEAELACSSPNVAQSQLVDRLRTRRLSRYLDPLTRVWNRAGVGELIDLAIAQATPLQSPSTLMLVEIQDLAELEQAQGPQATRQFTIHAALTILHAIRDSDCLGRFDRGCFAVIPDSFPNLENLRLIANRILGRFDDHPLPLGTAHHHASVKIGAAFIPAGTPITSTELLEFASGALDHAKRPDGPGIEVFSKGFVRLDLAA
jgi:diguanylate cyclase (GGDEF)-like protein